MSTEKDLHNTMIARDAASGAVRGGVLGGAVGAAMKKTRAGAVGGALLGTALGVARGRERVLKDQVGQKRVYEHRDDADRRSLQRTKDREAMKKSSVTIYGAFGDELEKLAIAGALGSLGKATLNVAQRGASAVGRGGAFRRFVAKGSQALGGRKNLRTAVGVGVAGTGAGYAAGKL